jgi:RNA polymerase sigma factor (sigma-70 family)
MVSQIKAWEPQADGPGGFADESALVAGLRARTPQAFEVLHAAYAPAIYNLALRVVDDPHEAQDVAQEVLIKVLRGLPGDDQGFTLPAWLYRVTVNASFDHLRARKRRPVTVTSEATSEPVSPVDDFERAELAHRVESTLKELPKRQQVALVLRDVHGLSVGETASVLGVTKGSADVLLSRARSAFRKVYLTGVQAAGRCSTADAILAGGVGGGISAADRVRLEDHARSCPDCRHTARLWGVAPAGLGVLLPQVALPAKLSLGATLLAAQAAGVALPAGLGAAAGAGAATAGAGAAGAAASAAGLSGSAGSAAASAAGTGVLAAIGSAAGVKVATVAVVAVAALGVAGAASRHQAATRVAPPAAAAALPGGNGGGPSGADAGARARLLARAHRGQAPDLGGRRGDEAGDRDRAAHGSGGAAISGGGTGATTGGGSTQGAGQGAASGGGSGGSAGTSAGQSATGASGGSGASGGPDGSGGGSGSGDGGGTGGTGSSGSGSGGTGGTGSGGGQTAAD